LSGRYRQSRYLSLSPHVFRRARKRDVRSIEVHRPSAAGRSTETCRREGDQVFVLSGSSANTERTTGAEDESPVRRKADRVDIFLTGHEVNVGAVEEQLEAPCGVLTQRTGDELDNVRIVYLTDPSHGFWSTEAEQNAIVAVEVERVYIRGAESNVRAVEVHRPGARSRVERHDVFVSEADPSDVTRRARAYVDYRRLGVSEDAGDRFARLKVDRRGARFCVPGAVAGVASDVGQIEGRSRIGFGDCVRPRQNFEEGLLLIIAEGEVVWRLNVIAEGERADGAVRIRLLLNNDRAGLQFVDEGALDSLAGVQVDGD